MFVLAIAADERVALLAVAELVRCFSTAPKAKG